MAGLFLIPSGINAACYFYNMEEWRIKLCLKIIWMKDMDLLLKGLSRLIVSVIYYRMVFASILKGCPVL